MHMAMKEKVLKELEDYYVLIQLKKQHAISYVIKIPKMNYGYKQH